MQMASLSPAEALKPAGQRGLPPALRTFVTGLAGFLTYFAMYAFRKPIGAAHFAHVAGWHFALDYKSALLISQVLGYALSKIVGIKVIAEMNGSRRAVAIIALVGSAWLALVLFALLPAPWNVACLFLNGMPLGMIWGLVFSYMEGRRTTEILGSMLCACFIVASGAVKSVGGWLLLSGISEFWMPAATGALFFPLLLASVWVLTLMPPPNDDDIAQRTRRVPMSGHDRLAFWREHSLPLTLLVASYLVITALRDFRDNFAAELWSALGYGDAPSMFSASELPIGIVVLPTLALIGLIHANRRAMAIMHGVIAFGMVLLAGSTLAFSLHLLSPLAWMTLTGAGLYLAYTPFNAMLFDRLIALFGKPGNSGFLIYVGDAAGYVASVTLLLYRSFAAPNLGWTRFYTDACYGVALVVTVCTVLSGWLILRKDGQARANSAVQPTARR